MITHFDGDFSLLSYADYDYSNSFRSELHQALMWIIPDIPKIIRGTPTRMWRGVHIEPDLIRLARGYRINSEKFVLNLHIGLLSGDDKVPAHFHPFGDMGVFMVSGSYNNTFGPVMQSENDILPSQEVRIKSGDTYFLGGNLCHKVDQIDGPTFSIMLHKRSGIQKAQPQDYDSVTILDEQRKEGLLNDLISRFFKTDYYDNLLYKKTGRVKPQILEPA